MKLNVQHARIFRVVAKALALFVAANVLYIALNPLPALSRLTIHNTLIPGRLRIPAVNAANDAGYGRATTNIDLMLATHEITAAPKPADEFRVLLLGDSATWGYLMDDEQTLAANLNRRHLVMQDGRRVRAFNLALPGITATKDLLLMQHVNRFSPDLVVWLVTPETFRQAGQKESFEVCSNLRLLTPIFERYGIDDIGCPFVPADNLLRRSIIGQRRDLAVILRMQIDGLLWAATGIDHKLLAPRDLKRSVDRSMNWVTLPGPVLHENDLTLNAMDAARGLIDGEMLVINEPMLILNGPNTDVRYNSEYPRWAYDQAMAMIEARARRLGMHYANLWDAVPADLFVDHELHYKPEGAVHVAGLIGNEILKINANTTASAQPKGK